MMNKRLLIVPIVGAVVLSACAVTSTDDASSSDEALSCTVPSTASASNPWWKSQYDDSLCASNDVYTNCGPTAVAMMRYALTCGQSNHKAGWMRTELNDKNGLPSSSCAPTGPKEWVKLLNATNGHAGEWIDGTPQYNAINHCDGDGYTIDDLAKSLSDGYVAVMAGSAYTGGDITSSHYDGYKAPCGFEDIHALFVGHWNGSTFSVYDPDSHNNPGSAKGANCGSTRTGHAAMEMSKKDLEGWSKGNGVISGICAVIANGANGGACVPGTKSATGCAASEEKTCTSGGTWGGCECNSGATRTCVSGGDPDCCGTCGHATQTCNGGVWTTGTCQNGC